MFSLQKLVRTIVYLVVAGLIFYLLYWLVHFIGLPAPFAKVADVVLAIFAVLVIIGVLLDLAGIYPIKGPPPA